MNQDSLSSPNQTSLAGLQPDLIQQIWLALGVAKRQWQVVAIAVVVIDRLKEINLDQGWETGDQLLQAVQQRLQLTVGMAGRVAWLGGDTFGIVWFSGADQETVHHWAHYLSEQLLPLYRVGEQLIHLPASIGIALSPAHGRNPKTLLAYAQTAARSCQQRGQAYEVYQSALSIANAERRFIETGLLTALEQNQFQVYYQPQVDAQTEALVGVEALLRWEHPYLGYIPCSRFIPIAEETRLIRPLGEWMLQTACRDIQTGNLSSFTPLHLSVNLSIRQLEHSQFLRSMEQLLNTTAFEPQRLVLELTETTLIENMPIVQDILVTLRGWGVQIAIDDFGIGFSSLHYLSHLPIDILKIDQSFIKQCTTDPKMATVTTAIIAMADCMELQVVAEGVETREQLAFLQAANVHIIQGHLYGSAQPAALFKLERLCQAPHPSLDG